MTKITIPIYLGNPNFSKEAALAELKRTGAYRVALCSARFIHETATDPDKKAFLKELIQYFRENGLEVGTWFGNTIGHGETLGVMSELSGGRATRYTQLRHLNGVELGGVFCPMDELLQQDLTELLRSLAECGPDVILLDDDFRLNNREQGLGCCCDRHMAVIREILGEDISVEELREKMFQDGKNKYRDAWIKAQGDSMRELSRVLRAAVDSVNPNVRLGYCASNDAYDYCGLSGYERAKILAGNTRPIVRTCGAPYWASNWRYHKRRFFLGEVVEFARLENGWLKAEGDVETMCEGDNYPRPRFECPAAYMECFDMILRADGTHDGILKYAVDFASKPDYEPGYVDMHVENEETYRQIARLFDDKTCVGFRPYVVAQTFENRHIDRNDPYQEEKIQYDMYCSSNRLATFNSLPVTYEDGAIQLVFGEHAKYIPVSALDNGAVIDITAAKFLMARGIDVGIERICPPNGMVKDEYYLAEQQYVSLDGSGIVFGYDAKDGIEPLSKYHLVNGDNIFSYEGSGEFIDGAFRYENARGQRFIVLPFDGDQVYDKRAWLDTYARRRMIIDNAEWLGKKPLDAYVNDNYLQLYIMVKKNETAMSVGLWNLYPDRIHNLKVHVATNSNEIEFLNCQGHRDGDCIVLDTPLYPYEFAAFEIQL